MADSQSTRHFVRINGKILGPFDQGQLQSLMSRGRLQPDHEISTDRRTWRPVSSLGASSAQPAATGVTSPEATGTAGAAPQTAEWYYSIGDEQRGPVPFQVLKKLASQGDVSPDDLVWHSGLDEWILASDQPGLFSSSRHDSRRIALSKRGQQGADVTRQSFVWNFIIRFLQELISEKQVTQLARILTIVGGYSLTTAMLMAMTGSLVYAIRQNSAWILLSGIGAILFISVFKFIGLYSIRSSDSLISSTPNQMSSPAVPHMAAATLLSIGILAPVGLIIFAILSDNIFDRFLAFHYASMFLLSLGISACFVLHTNWLNVQIVSSSRAGQEGVAILSFFLKLCARVSTVIFAIASISSVILLSIAGVIIIQSETILESVDDVSVLMAHSLILIAVAGLVPLVAYLTLAFGSILLDAMQSVIGLSHAGIASSQQSNALHPAGAHDD